MPRKKYWKKGLSKRKSKTENEGKKYSNAYTRNVSDYTRSVSDYTRNVSDYTRNVSDYARNVSDYARNVSEKPQNTTENSLKLTDNLQKLTGLPSQGTEISHKVMEISRNMTEDSQKVTIILPNERNIDYANVTPKQLTCNSRNVTDYSNCLTNNSELEYVIQIPQHLKENRYQQIMDEDSLLNVLDSKDDQHDVNKQSYPVLYLTESDFGVKTTDCNHGKIHIKSDIEMNPSEMTVNNKNNRTKQLHQIETELGIEGNGVGVKSGKSSNINTQSVNMKKGIICGSFNQGNSKYGNNSGKQCVCNSALAIVYSQLKNIESWNSSDLDFVLDKGNELYEFIRKSTSVTHDYLLVSELPHTIDLLGTRFMLDFGDSLPGIIGKELDIKGLGDILMTLEKALSVGLSDFSGCLVNFAQNTFSVIHQHGLYYVFDSHSRNCTTGYQISDGTSILIKALSIDEVYSHCMQLAQSMNLSEYTQFEITGILITPAKPFSTIECTSLTEIKNTPKQWSSDYHGDHDSKRNHEYDIGISNNERLSSNSRKCAAPQDTTRYITLSESDECDDVIVTGETMQRTVYTFEPLTLNITNAICTHLTIQNRWLDQEFIVCRNKSGHPCKTKSIVGDGNCFFRALSYAVSGTEDYHRKLRVAIMEHMRQNEERFTPYLRSPYTSVYDYIRSSKMNLLGIWATEVEIFVAANFLQYDIYIFGESWMRFPKEGLGSRPVSQMGIYLKHCNESHYEVVEHVSGVSSNTCTCLSSRLIPNNDLISFPGSVPDNDTSVFVENPVEHFPEKRSSKKRKKKSLFSVHRKKRKNPLNMTRCNRKTKDAKRYQKDELFADRKKRSFRDAYSTDPIHYREKRNEHYFDNAKYRNSVIARKRNLYHTDTTYREKVKLDGIKRYKHDDNYRNNLKKHSKTKYMSNEEHRLKKKDASMNKYRVDEEHRLRKKNASMIKYNIDEEHRVKKKHASMTKYQVDQQHRHKVKVSSIQKYKNSVHRRSALTEYVNWRRKSHRLDQSRINNVIKHFRSVICQGPIYVCCICHRLLFKKQVIQCKRDSYINKGRAAACIINKCLTTTYLHQCTEQCEEHCISPDNSKKLWICHTCHRKVNIGKMPAEAVVNNMGLEPVPEELACLNSLEQHLICLNIPFMKMMSLPKGGQHCVHGPVVCVPSKVHHPTDILPRTECDDLIIRVKLKRRLHYKGHYQYQFVNKAHLESALEYLKENNKWYASIHINGDWENPHSEITESDIKGTHVSGKDESENSNAITDNTTVQIELSDRCRANTVDARSPQKCRKKPIETGGNVNNSNNDDTDSLPDLDETVIEDEADLRLRGALMDTCLQPVDIGQEMLDQHFDDIVCVAPGEGNNPVNMMLDDGNEAKSFPVLFPNGLSTFKDERDERITLARYLNCRLMNADNRFARNTDYLFFAQYLSEVSQIASSVSIALRKGGKIEHKVTRDMLMEKENLKKLFKSDEGYKFLKPIRGTPPFWQAAQKDLFAMLRQLGIPTWFCSFSAADLRWNEVIEAILIQQGDHRNASELDWNQKCEVLRSNPVTVARMFDQRFHHFLTNVIMSQAQPIGKIVDYFYRVEFQQRGSPHTHCLFWVENAPKVGKDDDAMVTDFVDQYVTCDLPDSDDEELQEIVTSVQTHSSRHSKSCKKKGTECRFNFPRPPSNQTFICRPVESDDEYADSERPDKVNGFEKKTSENELNSFQKTSEKRDGDTKTSDKDQDVDQETSPNKMTPAIGRSILSSMWKALNDTEKDFKSIEELYTYLQINQTIFEKVMCLVTKKSHLVLQRDLRDVWINQYNADLLRCWNANMDIQYVFDAFACIVYIVSYISKSEREMSMLLDNTQREAVKQDNLDAKNAMKKIGTAFIDNREVSAQEAAYRVCNLRLKCGSRKVQFIPTGDNPIKLSLPLKVLQKKSEENDLDQEDIWMTGIVDRYKARPDNTDFNHLCLASFCSEYRIISHSEVSRSKGDATSIYQLKNNLGYIRKRSRTDPAVVRYARFSPTKSPELYYKSSLQLFLPHRTDTQLKPSTFESCEDFYQAGAVTISDKLETVKEIVERNRSLFEKEAQAIEDAQEVLEIDGCLEDAWAQICPETESERHETEQKRKDSLKSEEYFEKSKDLSTIPGLITSTKDHRMELRQTQLSHTQAENLLRSLNFKQRKIFYKIRQWCLDKVNGSNPEPFHVFVTGGAGTGKSHLIRSIQYECTRILARNLPNPDDISVLLTAPTGVAAFNIGASTIHNTFLINVDSRLPYQRLSEEKLNTLRAKLSALEILIIDEISMVDHKILQYIHGRLKQVKQTGEAPFGKVSIIAVGDFYQLPPVLGTPLFRPSAVNLWQDNFSLVELNEIMRQKEDLTFASVLNRIRQKMRSDVMPQRDIALLQTCEKQDESDCLHIFSKNTQVDKFNMTSLESICEEPVVIEAQDFAKDGRTGKLIRRDKPHSRSLCKNSNLSTTLYIAEGARVMLTRNIDVTDGLVNGVFGKVTLIEMETTGSFPKVIHVKFDHEVIGQKLRRSVGVTSQETTPIEPHEDNLNKKGAVRRQFPLKLAWACTVHKVQGLTVDKAVVSLDEIFSPGQAYVALSRVKTISGLTIQGFNEHAIFCNKNVQKSLSDMPAFLPADTNRVTDSSVNIILHNIQGLLVHYQDLEKDVRILSADFVCLTETWLTDIGISSLCPLTHFDFYNVPRAVSYDDSTDTTAVLMHQAHGGVGLYAKTQKKYSIIRSTVKNLEHLLFNIYDGDLTVAVIYRPPSYKVKQFTKTLEMLLKTLVGKIIVMGDFNENTLSGSSVIEELFQDRGYVQCITSPTTDMGTIIDHVYIKGFDDVPDVTIIPTYYSYHEAIQIKLH